MQLNKKSFWKAGLARFASSGAWIPLLVGMYVAVGDMATRRMGIPFRSVLLYVEMLLLAALMVCVFHYAYRWLLRASHADELEQPVADGLEQPSAYKQRLLVFWHQLTPKSVGHDTLLLAACWSPYALLLFPEVMGWDAGDQLAQFFGISAFGMPEGQIWDHHPFLDTYLWGGFALVGHKLTGSYFSGITVFLILQLLAGALVIAHALAYFTSRLNAPANLVRAVTVFFCVFPMFPIAFLSLYKDYTHLVFFIPWCVMFTELVRTRLGSLKKPWFFAAFLVISVLASMTKKTGMYVILFCVLFLLLVKAAAKLKVLVAALLALIFAFSSVLPAAVLFKPLGVVKSNASFAVVVPINMVARVAHEDPQGVTQEEKQVVESFVGLDWQTLGDSYNPYSSDPITVLNPRDQEVSLAKFMSVWLSIGLKRPKVYVNSFFAQTSGWVALQRPESRSVSNGNNDGNYVPNILFSRIKAYVITCINGDTYGSLVDTQKDESCKGDAVLGRYQSFVKNLLQWLHGIPVLNVLFYAAIWIILPFFLLYAIWQRRRTICAPRALLTLLPLVVSVLTLFLYAVSGGDYVHYMFHAVVLGPLYLLYSFATKTISTGAATNTEPRRG